MRVKPESNSAISDRLEVTVDSFLNKGPHIPGYQCFYAKVLGDGRKTLIYRRIV